MHLRARHTFTPADQEQRQTKLPPNIEGPLSQSSFETAVEEAFAARDIPRIAQLITQLTDRDQQVQRMLRVIHGRSRRRRLDHPDDATSNAADAQQREKLLAEDNFRRVMSLFDLACSTHIDKSSNQTMRSLASHFPPSVYHALLRSCSYHASVDAAIRIYSFLEARVRSSRSFQPTTTVFYYLLSTYINANDLAGAKDVFAEFKGLCARDEISIVEAYSHVKIWNKMMEAYFMAGQPAGALRLLETMMDAESTPSQGISSPLKVTSSF